MKALTAGSIEVTVHELTVVYEVSCVIGFTTQYELHRVQHASISELAFLKVLEALIGRARATRVSSKADNDLCLDVELVKFACMIVRKVLGGGGAIEEYRGISLLAIGVLDAGVATMAEELMAVTCNG